MKMLSQRTKAAIVAAALLAQSGAAMAQARPASPIIPGAASPEARPAGAIIPGIAPVITAAPGNYNINTQDTSRILSEILNRSSKVQDSDRQYLETTVNAINTQFTEYMKIIISGELKQLSDRSKSQAIDAEAYLAVVNKVNEMRLSLDSKIAALTSISRGALPSAAQSLAGEQVQQYGNIDFTNIINYYTSRIEGVTAVATNYPMKVVFKSHRIPQVIQANSGKTLAPEFDIPLFSPAEIEKMQDDILDLRTPSEKLDRMKNDQANELKRLIMTMSTNYGTSEKYRFMNASDYQARNDAYKKIVEIFWSRSYLRAKYGVRLGAIQPAQYDKRWVNLEKFTIATNALGKFRQEIAEDDIELANAAENIRNILEVLDNRSASILKGDASLLVRANSLITLLKGDRPNAEVLLMTARLVAADIKEEQMLASGGGLATLFSFYQQRYQSTAELKNTYQSFKCGYDTLLKPGACPSASSFKDVPSLSGGGLKAIFQTMNMELNLSAKNLSDAMKIEEQIKLAMIASGGKAIEDVNNRADQL